MLHKHSLTIKGHRTSITLEDPFWDVLKTSAKQQGCSLSQLVEQIDEGRTEDTNLSSALRLFVLRELQKNSQQNT